MPAHGYIINYIPYTNLMLACNIKKAGFSVEISFFSSISLLPRNCTITSLYKIS